MCSRKGCGMWDVGCGVEKSRYLSVLACDGTLLGPAGPAYL